MEKDKPMLFSRLRNLGRRLDQDIVSLKEEFSKPAKSAPQYYDRGLNALKKEIQDVKEEKEAAKKVQGSLQNFSNWLESVKELVDKQADDASKIETYLMKFGYIPMEKPSGLFLSSELQREESAQKQETLKERNGESENTKEINKPPAITVPPSSGKKNLKSQEKSAVVASALNSKIGKSGTTVVGYEKTPVSSKVISVNRSAAGLGSSYNESHGGRSIAIEQWLQGVETCEVVTPDVLHNKRVPQREIQVSIKTESETVDEAIVPTITVTKIDSGTPKEPLLSYQVPEVKSSKSIDKRTPEEPVLSSNASAMKTSSNLYTETGNSDDLPPSPELSDITRSFLSQKKQNFGIARGNTMKDYCGTKIGSRTPEEPLLSYQFPENKSSKSIDKRTPEEPVLSGYASAMKTSSNLYTEPGNSDDLPPSPELSDITRSFLSQRNQNFGIARGNTMKDYCGMRPNKSEDQYLYKNRRTLASHYEKQPSHSRHERDLDAKPVKENVPSYIRGPQERKNWPIPGVKVEEFLGVEVNDIPPSPQLSETTQRLFSWK